MTTNPGANWNYPLGKVTITASQVGVKIPVPIGGSFQQSVWLEIYDESPYIITIYSSQGIILNQINPQICDIVQLPQGDTLFYIQPNLLLPQASPSSEVDINVYPFGKPQGAYPIPLGRQAATPGPEALAGGFSFSTLLNMPTGGAGGIKIANVSTTKLLVFYACILITTQVLASLPQAQVGWVSNTIALGVSGLTPASNISNGNLVSVAAISQQTTGAVALTQVWAFSFVGPGIPFNFIPFPDKKLVPPGESLVVNISNGSGAASWALIVPWTEQ